MQRVVQGEDKDYTGGIYMDWPRAFTVVDFIYLGIMMIGLAIGWARGLIEQLTGFFAFIAGIFVAGRYSIAVVNWLNRTWSVQAALAESLDRRINLPSETFRVPTQAIPQSKVLEWLRELHMPATHKVNLAQQAAEWSRTTHSQTTAEYLIDQLAGGVLYILVFIMVSLLVSWALGFLGRLVSDQVKEIPVFGTLNRALGGAVTLFETAMLLSIAAVLIIPMISMYGFDELGRTINNAQLTPSLLTFFDWVRGPFFGTARGFFFFP